MSKQTFTLFTYTFRLNTTLQCSGFWARAASVKGKNAQAINNYISIIIIIGYILLYTCAYGNFYLITQNIT